MTTSKSTEQPGYQQPQDQTTGQQRGHHSNGKIKKNTWEDAVYKYMIKNPGPHYYEDIANGIISEGLYDTKGKTPHKTVSRILTTNKHDRYVFVGSGVYELKISKNVILQYLNDKILNQFNKETRSFPPTTEANQITRRRIGQNILRNELIDESSSCIITGI